MGAPNSTSSSTVIGPAYSPTSTDAGSPFSLPTPNTITSKEWIVPPRPKPGRKPATDTPPTKRKAQNRAAQRAFRERRAARVGELEEQIKQMEEEDEQEQTELRDQIANLAAELDKCKGALKTWTEECEALRRELATERRAKKNVMLQHAEARSVKEQNSMSATKANATVDQVQALPLGCGNCSSETRCRCIDEAFNIDATSHHKRPPSPQQANTTKRIKSEPEELEIDFTNAFTTTAGKPIEVASPTNAIDRCGFCSDGTPCICAEMAAESTPAELGTVRSQFTPPPSDGDVSIQAGPPAVSNPCVNGPGTCAQCRADPRSTLFCKTLAASQSGWSCCGGSKPGASGCCQTRSLPNSRSGLGASSSSSNDHLALNCAEVYTTLSRHKAFSKATDDLGSWIPKLHTRSLMSGSEGLRERPAMEIEAASVMSVMQFFDRKYGETSIGDDS